MRQGDQLHIHIGQRADVAGLLGELLHQLQRFLIKIPLLNLKWYLLEILLRLLILQLCDHVACGHQTVVLAQFGDFGT